VVGLGLEHAGRATLGDTGLRYRSVGTAEAFEHPGEGPVVLLGTAHARSERGGNRTAPQPVAVAV
jgi:hypothetical protein